MEQKKVDRRVAKTKRAIYSAFAELLSQRAIDEITIREIVDIADINRKTFYNYYPGIHALLDEIENSTVQTFEAALGEIDFREAVKNPSPVFEKLTEIINSDLEFYGNLISMKSNVSLITKIAVLLKEKTREAVIKQLPDIEDKADMILDFIFSGMFSVYRNWFLSDRSQSIEEISGTLSELCFNGLNGVLALSAD